MPSSVEWLVADDAIKLILAARETNIPLLGFDAAYITDTTIELSQEGSWDYGSDAYPKVSDPYSHAINFIHERSQKGLRFEIVLDREIQ